MPEPGNHEEPTTELHIADILDRYRQGLQDGDDPDPEACLGAHPELMGELTDCLQGLAAMEELRAALNVVQPAPFAPRALGDFHLVREVGRGGMGVVYEAIHTRLDRRVALKMIKAGSLADGQDLELFRQEALAVACLQHPNIVQLHEVGEHDGQPYLVLEYLDGGSLDAQLAGTPLEPYRAAHLLQTLALAMHYAHERGIVHRDLKPANVLLVAGGSANTDGRSPAVAFVPKITDFGLAKRLHADLGQTQSGTIKGTPSYMAPEQASGQTRAIGPLADVYALGALLYETLTGRPPFRAATALDTLVQVTSLEPVPPSRLQPQVPRDLETICLKCLRKEPHKRYGSAQDLADELGRFLRHEPIRARPVGVRGRAWRWCRRHPGIAWMSAVAAVLLSVVGLLTVLRVADAAAARARETGRREEILRGNGYAAQGVANSVLVHLRDLSRAVEQTALEPRLRALLEKEDRKGLQTFFVGIHAHYDDPEQGLARSRDDPPFKSWYVLSSGGVLLAVTPPNPKVVGAAFQGRDYFHGALRRAKLAGRAAIHVARVFRSRNDQRYKFGIAAVVHGDKGAILGVVVATVTTNSTMGLLQLHDERQKAVLVGPEDTDPPDRPAAAVSRPGDYLILLHPAYERGEDAVRLPAREVPNVQHGSEDELRPPLPQPRERAGMVRDDYEDPVGARHERYRGRWLAGFAPVGNTEFLVIVQQRREGAADEQGGAWSLWYWLLLGGGTFLAAGLVGVAVWRRRRQQIPV